MGLDSVEIVMAWEDAFGIEIPDAAASGLRNTTDAVDYIYSQLPTSQSTGSAERRAFFELRAALVHRFNVPRRAVRPATPVKSLLPSDQTGAAWKDFSRDFGIPARLALPSRGEGPTVGEVTLALLGHAPQRFGPSDGRWSRPEVREVVRAIVIEEAGVPADYPDEAHFVRDLGIN